MSKHYYVYQIAYIYPLLKALGDSGVSIERLIGKSSLKHFNLSNSNKYIPAEVFYDFLVLARDSQWNRSFIASFPEYFKISDLGSYGANLSKSPTLYGVLHQFIVYKSVFQTNINAGLDIFDDQAKFTFSLVDKFSSGRKISENIFLAMLFNLFRSFETKDWLPIELHIPYNIISDIKPMLPRGKYKLLLNQQEHAIVFPRKILHKATNISLNFSETISPKAPNLTVATTIEEVLTSYKSGYIPSLGDLAKHFNTSESSLKRSLRSENTKFSKILENILYQKAISLLAETNMNITLVSEHLGYSDSPNFIRSFKKWSGKTPGAFRSNEKHELV